MRLELELRTGQQTYFVVASVYDLCNYLPTYLSMRLAV
jgi:hypothetical protein